MNALTQKILLKSSTLPEQAQQEVLDFIEFLQLKWRQREHVEKPADSLKSRLSDDKEQCSPIYRAFEQAGLIGCISTDEQLSTTYKEKIDFSFKHGD